MLRLAVAAKYSSAIGGGLPLQLSRVCAANVEMESWRIVAGYLPRIRRQYIQDGNGDFVSARRSRAEIDAAEFAAF